ncbi:MAG: M1 family metallopeptidase [Pseudomonadota bacterium]
MAQHVSLLAQKAPRKIGMVRTHVFGLLAFGVLLGCGSETSVSDKLSGEPITEAQNSALAAPPPSDIDLLFLPETADRLDKFSYSNFEDVVVRHASFDLDLDFETRSILGTVVLDVEKIDQTASRIVLDTDDITIAVVETSSADGVWAPTEFLLGSDDPMLGAPLQIDLPSNVSKVRIAYVTSSNAAGLQWLTPEQTAGAETPFVYSQAQAIHARSMAPLQDTPAVRMTYDAKISVKGVPEEDVLVLMAAEQPADQTRDGVFEFSMPQPVPPYLLAIAAGDMEFRGISDTIGIYAESYIIEEAAAEFSETPKMMDVASDLYGPYQWGRYDMIVLPPSFPFGGMENPRLSFLTPTLIAGDKSLTNVVAHELAHSWSGNLVTNATWRDSWLNEGFTTYVENRIMEALYTEERAAMERSLDLVSLRAEIDAMEDKSLSRLKLPTSLASTDDAFSSVAYVKGMFFLKRLEEVYGREAFDPFLKSYFDKFAFKAIVTEDFLAYLEATLVTEYPDAISIEEIAQWVSAPGLPDTIEQPSSNRFALVDGQLADWLEGQRAAADISVASWTSHEWLHFINSLPESLVTEQMQELDSAFSLSYSPNAEIASAWYLKTIPANYPPVFDPLKNFLENVGRGKFIYRIYAALAENPDRFDWATDVYGGARPGYHPIAQRRIDAIFGLGDGTVAGR